ncbi:MAG TPA: ABC transporter permease [Terracidiphilus sp.]|nr:ABC transporter permease [Terracidiphilus sp.]
MRTLRALWKRLTGTSDACNDFDAELESHLAHHIDDGIRAGLTPEEARRQALIQLGGMEQARQAYRERATLPRFDSILRDARYALRQMRRSPGFTLTAILTLALGIGANAVMYTLVDSILLRPLPYAQQDRLMRIQYDPDDASFYPKGWLRALAEHSAAFQSISGFTADAESNVDQGDAPSRIFGAEVMTNAFDTLGLKPAAGRFFSNDDARASNEPVVVLSYGYWRQRFGESPQAVGQTIRIDGKWKRIIGVMPAGVHFPYSDTQFVTPVTFDPTNPIDPWNNFSLRAFGRLNNGFTSSQAQAELHRLHGLLLPLFPWRMPDIWASNMIVVPLLESETGAMRPRLLLLFGAVGLILLIACANVANLMLARSTAREREIAIRSTLGASSTRLIQQLLSESVVLGLAAGVVGLIAAFASLRIFVGLLPADTPRLADVRLHAGDALFTLGASLVAGLLFGLIPSLRMAATDMQTALRSGGRSLMGKGSRFGVSMALVVAQIGLSVLVITAAGLVLRSLYKLSRVDPGFRTDHTVTAEIALDSSACTQPGRCQSFYDALLARMQGVSGVESAALTDSLPFSGLDGNYVFDAENHPRDPRQGAMLATGRTVSPGYFNVLGLKLLHGRLLTQEDASGSTHAVVINEQMAQHLWPGADPIGKHLLKVADEPTPAIWNAAKASVVVGVLRNARESSLRGNIVDEVYLPLTPGREQPVMHAVLRTHLSPQSAAAELRRAVASINAQVPVTHVRSMNEVVSGSVTDSRSLALLLLGFGSLAVIIGGVGVYSLIAYIVSWRTREIGLRLALGAQRWQIVASVVGQSLLLAVSGCVLGLAGAVALGRLLRSFLFEVSTVDPVTFIAVPALMLLLALAAACIPARRAASVDPMTALRIE